jgi:hypothetical protein
MPVALQRMWIQLTADRKRFGVLCAFMAVGLLLWARVIIVSNVPKTAIAEDEKKVSSATEASGQVMGTHAAAQRLRIEVALDAAPARDPFVISTRHFPKPAIEGELVRDQGKSGPEPAEDAEQVKARQIAVLTSFVNRLKLDAVMSGGTPEAFAVINGVTHRLGDLVYPTGNQEFAFEIVEVKHRSVVLRSDEHFFELSMVNPKR